MILKPSLTELLTYIVYKLLLQSHACLPYLAILNIVDSLPYLLVALVRHKLLVEVLSIHILPLSSSPCWEVNTIGNISYMIFLREISVPNRREHLLAHPAMQLTYAVDFLTCIACECRHTEFLGMIIRICTAHTNELIPRNTKLCRISTHILTEQAFIKIVMTCWHRSMYSIERRCTNKLHGLVE